MAANFAQNAADFNAGVGVGFEHAPKKGWGRLVPMFSALSA